METKYPTLRRPKRKLCYFTNKESSSKQWTGTLALEDVDKMFDDLDPSSNADDDLPTSSLVLQISDTERNHTEREAPPVPQEGHQMEKLPRCQVNLKDLKGDVLLSAKRSLSPKLDIEFDLPFKAHAPVKTSSPIDKNMAVEGVEELDNEKDQVVSPILFACDDEGKEEAKTEPLPTLTPQCNGHVTEESHDSDLESPPHLVCLGKPMMSSHKNKVEGSCKESHPVKEKAPQTADLEGNRKAPRQENTHPPVSAVSQEPEVGTPKKIPDGVYKQTSMEVSNRQTSFLQKLREAGQPKPACSRKFLSPVKVPVSAEPEDDFLILEDDAPIWFSIPSKTATSKRQKQSKTSSTDKDSSTDKGVKDSSLETAQKQQEFAQTNSKLGNQTVNQKIKKMKEKDKKKKEATDPENYMEELPSPEDLPAGNLTEQEKPNKKKRLKKVPSKESEKAEEKPEDTASRESDEEQPTLKMKKKAQKSSDTKRSKSLKDGNENSKTSRTKSIKGARKVTQGSGAVNETEYADASKGQSQKQERGEQADAEYLGPLSDKEIMNSEAPTDEKDKRNKLPAVCEESSSEDSLFGKRKRRQPGQWWLPSDCPQSSEETKVSDNQPTLKKAKQNNKEPSAAVLSPVKTKKDRVLKKRNQTQPAQSSNQNTNKAKEKKIKGNKNRNTRGDVSDKIKAEVESEQIGGQEQQLQEVMDQDLDGEESSPLVLAHRDHSLDSGDQVFQRVYHHISTEKVSKKAAPVSPRGSREQHRTTDSERRRRKPPGNWWAVDGPTEDVESISSQPQQQEPKPRKERKKRSKQSRSPGLGNPKNGNMAVLSKQRGGAPVPPPLSAPKTIKRSLATFKDIFTSATETPTAVSRKEAGQNNRRKVSAHPAVEVTVTDCSALSKTNEEILGTDAGESNSPPNHEVLQDSKFQSENTLKALRSGPSSMIELELYEDDDDLIPSTVNAVLSASDLCAPPLKPLVLQSKDKANLTEWFKSLWSTTVEHGPEITPDQFDWYFHQGRAIGFLVDLNTGSICNGKILLGSYMKKPLWVDHSATTVFNLLTSSVSVTINGRESRVHPGQSFMVSCGHAYSIQNVTAQPAVLYFTRIWAENSD